MLFGHLKVIEEVTRRRCDQVILSGGASKGKLWPRIMAGVLGLPVKVPAVKESTALGSAIFAGIGAGIYPDLETATRNVVSFDPAVDPDPEVHSLYVDL
ncbi:MAG: FGGY-family carbohydrate kinase [Candidatus Dormibacter sp.]